MERRIEPDVKLSFDDVQLKDGYSVISSRSQVGLSCRLGDYKFPTPIMTAAMSAINSVEMQVALNKKGITHVWHRYNSVKDRANLNQEGFTKSCYEDGDFSEDLGGMAVAVGYNETADDIDWLINSGAASMIVLDVAACNHQLTIEQLLTIGPVCQDYDVPLVVGNFSNVEFLFYLDKTPAADFVTAVKVSQGGGSVCSTRLKTGVGVPTFQAVCDVVDLNQTQLLDREYPVIADGGLRTPGDVVKALGAGASMVMMGSYFSGTDECPGEYKEIDGVPHKAYYGMASRKAKQAHFKDVKNVEGVAAWVPSKGPVSNVVDDLLESIQSGISLCGFCSVDEFQGNGHFIRVSNAGVNEAQTHIHEKGLIV